MNVVDFRPLMDGVVFPVVTAVLSVVVPPFVLAAVVRIGQLAHLSVSQGQAAAVEAAMQNGVTQVLGRAQAAADAGGMKVTVDQPMIANAATYVIDKVQPEMKALGITDASLADRIEARIWARVPSIAPAQIPPPAPAPAVTA